jgi:hypothetical protein
MMEKETQDDDEEEGSRSESWRTLYGSDIIFLFFNVIF